MKNALLLCCLSLFLGQIARSQPVPAQVSVQEVAKFVQPKRPLRCFDCAQQPEPQGPALGSQEQWLNLGYAAANLRGTLPDTTGIVVESVSLVFTRDPVNPNAWRHEFGVLLQDRYTALHKVLPQAFAPGVDWSWTLQTACTTESQAMKLPHGFVVRYHYRSSPWSLSGAEGPGGSVQQPPVGAVTVRFDSAQRPPKVQPLNSAILELLLAHPMYSAVEVGRIVSGEQAVKDSTVLKTLGRHPEWKDMLVVMDWTSSMYHYGASALLWHKLNLDARRVKGFTFFNDGNYMPDIDKGSCPVLD